VYAVDQLDQRLKLAFGDEAVFRDASSLAPGAVFPERIRRALDVTRVALVVIGPGWLRASTDPSDSLSPRRLDDAADWVAIEIETLLGRGDGVSVIPVLLGGASIPKPDDLPPTLAALSSRNGVTLAPFPEFEDGLRRVIEAVATILGIAAQPFAPPSTVVQAPPRFGGNGFSVTGKNFVGREPELHLLDEAWGRAQTKDKINIVSLIGQGGEGKSALVLEWQARRARQGWQGARRVFEWSFYSQGSSAQSSTSADDFFNAAFAWFDKTAEVPRDPFSKGAKLAELVATERTLLVLDGLEPLQQPPGGFGGEFKDPAMKALLCGLARHNPGLCILTSRTDITDLASYEHRDGSCLRHPLASLDPVAARALLRQLGVLGHDRELDEAAACFHCHAYDLNLLGNYLAKCTPDRDIRGWQQRFPILREDGRIHPKSDADGKPAGHGRRMLRAYERWLEPPVSWRRWLPTWLGGRKPRRSPALAVLRLLGLFDRPARSDLLDELRAAPVIPGLTEALVSLSQDDWLLALEQLQGLALIHRQPLSMPGAGPRRAATFALDTHPLLREHFAAELRAQHEAAWREGHRRLYAYLCATTQDKPEPTLEDLQPLYQAVTHGCQAGLQKEADHKVYDARIQRGQAYSSKKLGAFGSDLGAIACFFETPWSRISPTLNESEQAWLLNEAAFRLQALGRLTEAVDPMRTALEIAVKQENWRSAAIRANNLCDIELTLGEVAGAEGHADASAVYAGHSGDAYLRMIFSTTHANALNQMGRRDEAEALFREAERVQADIQPADRHLYSMAGFRYCDLLLTEAEREAGKTEGERKREDLLARCHAVSERAAQTCKIAESNHWLLDIAHDHLTLGRVALYAAILESRSRRKESAPPPPASQPDLASAATEIDHAVSGLRRSGHQDCLPRGLLARAWLRSLTGRATGPDSAQSDLDEAWEIAERGPMPLFLADIHLYRARLFLRANPYPWQAAQHDLAEARRLIVKHGYLRRKEELEDAEAALGRPSSV
jgi:tetratricopeptide (TPR) repeat protein